MSVTLLQINNHLKNKLNKVYSNDEIQQLRFLIYENVLGFNKIQSLTNTEYALNSAEIENISEIIDRLNTNEPIEYILNEAVFFDFKFKLNNTVLIPRPETEELVDWIVKECKFPTPRVLDIGTGSGCIPISLNKFIPESEIFALDISADAIKTATENARLNNAHVNFFEHDILSTEKDILPKELDIIVSNPPYVCESEKKLMKANVLDFEPEIALFVNDNDPLIYYRTIATLAKNLLNKNGLLFFEINETLPNETKNMLTDLGFKHIELRKDINQKYRMVKASF